MEITKEMTHAAYDVAKKVYEGHLPRKDGINQLVNLSKINPGSAPGFISNFNSLLEGNEYNWTLNNYTSDYFLRNILKDYGKKGLEKALNAFYQHIIYYESKTKLNSPGMWEVYKKYNVLINDNSDEIEQDKLENLIDGKSRESIIEDLRNLKPTDSEEVTFKGKRYKRDNLTIAQIKLIRDYKCQICSNTIKKKKGLYIEAAHIIPKSKKGRETPDNILILCPNHHKEFDYGERHIINHDKEQVEFELNGINYKLSLKIE